MAKEVKQTKPSVAKVILSFKMFEHILKLTLTTFNSYLSGLIRASHSCLPFTGVEGVISMT